MEMPSAAVRVPLILPSSPMIAATAVAWAYGKTKRSPRGHARGRSVTGSAHVTLPERGRSVTGSAHVTLPEREHEAAPIIRGCIPVQWLGMHTRPVTCKM